VDGLLRAILLRTGAIKPEEDDMAHDMIWKIREEDTEFFVNKVKSAISGLDDEGAQHAVDVMISTIPKALKNGDQMEVPGLGTFFVQRSKEGRKLADFKPSIGHA